MIKTVRRSLIIFSFQVFGFVLLMILPLLVAYFFKMYLSSYVTIGTESDLIGLWRIFLGIWFLFLWVGLSLKFTNYFLDIWIVTDKRIIDVDQKALFNRRVVYMNLDRIQDVSVETKGLLRTIFKVGDVHVQTAGAETNFVIKDARSPSSVKEAILKASAEFGKNE